MVTEGGEEASTSAECQSISTKGHTINVYLTDSDKEAIVDFAKDHEELYNKTNKHFKDKAMMDCLWERFASSSKLSVKVCKTWSPKDSLWKLNTIQVWPGSQGNVREVELDSGQI